MEREDIATPPLSLGPDAAGSIKAQNERMDRRAREVDERVIRGICGGCD
jgi:hypothetical protein